MSPMTSPQARWMVAILFAVALPFCCCNGRFISRVVGAVVVAPDVAHAHDHAKDSHRPGHSYPADGHCSSSPSDESAPCDDDGPCDCDQHKQIKSLPESPTTVDLFSAVFAILPSIDSAASAPEPMVIARLSAAAVAKPPASLLRLHCALTI